MSAAIVKFKYPEVELFGWDYGQPIPVLDAEKHSDLIMVDISFSPEIMINLCDLFFITWIDHHQSAIKDSKNDFYEAVDGIRNSRYAACELTWVYFFPNQEMPEIVRLLGRYDCFGHKGTNEELKVIEFQYGARQLIGSPDAALSWLNSSMCNPSDINNIHSIGKEIYRYLYNEAKQIYARAFPVVFLVHNSNSEKTAYQILCVNQERFNPINFGINYHKDKYNGFLCFHYAKGKWNFSLYNDNGELDCSEICKMLGGGGHKGAAGFVSEELEFITALTQRKMIQLNPLK